MKKVFFAGLLIFTVSCSSRENSNTSSNSDNNTSKGNSPGSNTIEMDTLHMDTSGEKSGTDSGH